MKEPIVCDIPNWSLSYLINSDDTGINADDKCLCDLWWNDLSKQGYSVISPTDDVNDFCRYPEFGLACDTTKCKIF